MRMNLSSSMAKFSNYSTGMLYYENTFGSSALPREHEEDQEEDKNDRIIYL